MWLATTDIVGGLESLKALTVRDRRLLGRLEVVLRQHETGPKILCVDHNFHFQEFQLLLDAKTKTSLHQCDPSIRAPFL